MHTSETNRSFQKKTLFITVHSFLTYFKITQFNYVSFKNLNESRLLFYAPIYLKSNQILSLLSENVYVEKIRFK